MSKKDKVFLGLGLAGAVAATCLNSYQWRSTLRQVEESRDKAMVLVGKLEYLQELTEVAYEVEKEAVKILREEVAAAVAKEEAEEAKRQADAAERPVVKEVRVAKTTREIMKFGYPSYENLKCHTGFVTSYDRRNRTANWSCERIGPDTLQRPAGKSADREHSRFTEDESVPEAFRSLLLDYRGSGYDRGHLTPAGDIKFSQQAMNETFLLSNISPQVGHGFNRHYWARLEQFTRSLVHAGAEKGSERNVFCCTGPLYLPERSEEDNRWYVHYRMIPDEEPHVAVPTHFFKALAVQSADGKTVATGAFVVPNRQLPTDVPLTSFAVSLEELERKSGLQLFPELDRQTTVPLESLTPLELPPQDWWKTKQTSSKPALTEEEVEKKLDAFVASPALELPFGADLSPMERKMVHAAAGKRKLLHESKGFGKERHVVVAKEAAGPVDVPAEAAADAATTLAAPGDGVVDGATLATPVSA